MPVVYEAVNVCLEVDANNQCTAWQVVNSGDYISPELVGAIIVFAFILNIAVYGIKNLKAVI